MVNQSIIEAPAIRRIEGAGFALVFIDPQLEFPLPFPPPPRRPRRICPRATSSRRRMMMTTKSFLHADFSLII